MKTVTLSRISRIRETKYTDTTHIHAHIAAKVDLHEHALMF